MGQEVERMKLKLHMVTIEDPVPEEHFLRKLEMALDLSYIMRRKSYTAAGMAGRPSTRWGW